MSSQLVDMNADGFNDILVGSFEGLPFLIKGSKEGYGEPEQILDVSGEAVLICDFWNHEDKKWDKTDRAQSEGHCTSVSAVDWDSDGDLDLILGDYYGGRLFVRINEGTKQEPAFAKTNQVIRAGGKPLVIAKGLAAPRVVDWNRDGLFDLLCGGAKGGVFYFENTGTKTAPEFAASETLIEPLKNDEFIVRVPAVDGQPAMPGSSYHIETADYDGDGDLDLLVGGRSSWLSGPVKKLSQEELEAAKELQTKMRESSQKISELMSAGETNEERKEIIAGDEYKQLISEYQKLIRESKQYETEPVENGDFVWMFRRK